MNVSCLVKYHNKTINFIQHGDWLAPLLLRAYLAPILLQAGWNKLNHFDQTVAWFANSEWGLGLPMPTLMAALAGGAEFFGGVALILGFATRLFTIPLMVTMLVAAWTVHWPNGWLAISDASSWLANERVIAASEQLIKGRELLETYGHYDWLTEYGRFVILNNGIEFAATYFIMLLVLMFTGSGRYISIDYWLKKSLHC